MLSRNMEGHVNANVEYLSNALYMQRTRDAIMEGWNHDTETIDWHIASSNPRLHLSHMPSLFSSFDASLGVDKIFSRLALANDVRNEAGELLFKPDYCRSFLRSTEDLLPSRFSGKVMC